MSVGISVIVPFKNAEKTILQCMKSIATQSFQNFEVLLISDNSTDNSIEIVQKFQKNDERFNLLENDGVIHGVSSARNLGISHVHQDYVTFIDSDDYVDEDFLTTFVDMLDREKVVFPISGVLNEQKGDSKENTNFTHATMQFDKENAILQLLRNDSFEGYVFNKLFKTAMIKQNDLKFDSDISFSEDLLFCFQYIINLDAKAIIQYSLKRTYHYVNNPLSVMNNSKIGRAFDKRELTLLDAFDQMIKTAIQYSVSPVILRTLKVRKTWACSLLLRKFHYLKLYEYENWLEYKRNTRMVQKYVIQKLGIFLASKLYGLRDKLILSVDLFFPRIFVKLWNNQHRGA